MESPPPNGVWLERADGRCIPVAGNCAIGRSSSCDVQIDSAKASRNHATIHAQDNGEFWLIELGSSNGTQLNDRRLVRPMLLKDGDRVTVAETTLVFHQTAASHDEASLTDATVVDVRREKRWLLLADIVGYTPLSQTLPPEELATLIGRWVRRQREIVEGNDGTVNKYLGDGYLACWPGGSEATAHIASAMESFRVQAEKAEPKFRIVLHHGKVLIGGSGTASFGEESLMGPEVNFVFRMEKIAGATRTAFCFSSAAQSLLADHLPLRPLEGRHEMKGFPGNYELFQI